MGASAETEIWRLLEPFHGLYLAGEVVDTYAQLGLTGWDAYFANRAAPLGDASVQQLTEVFYIFDPRLIAKSVPAVWEVVTPADLAQKRFDAADKAIRHRHPILAQRPEMILGLADELGSVAARCLAEGGAFVAAHGTVPVPEEAHLRLWWAATIHREYRGEGHFEALRREAIGPCEALVLEAAAVGTPDLAPLSRRRGWTLSELQAALGRLNDLGYVTRAGALTESGVQVRERVLAQTEGRVAAVFDGNSAERILEALRWLDPQDNQGSRTSPRP